MNHSFSLMCPSYMQVSGHDQKYKDLGKKLSIFNLYGPCDGRKMFCQNFRNVDEIKDDNIILGEDLNLIRKVAGTWGEGARQDTLASYFTQLFQDLGLCDVEPNELIPTQRNCGSSRKVVSKCLESRLISSGIKGFRRSRQT